MGAAFETFEVFIELVPVEGSATVADVTAGVRAYWTEGRNESESVFREVRLERGAAIELERNVSIPAGGRLVVEFANGEERAFQAPPDKKRTLCFKDAAEMRKPPGNFYRSS
jgi:hypothetical protein